MILNRDQFREQVFSRDKYKCVVCKKIACDAHHIIDRSLFKDGGYYLNNGVSLCDTHHYQAEQTLLSCEKLRNLSNITEIILPDHFDCKENYDHWGNTILPNGMRLKGELFNEKNVQKILSEANILKFFLKYFKYPKTYHAPWSPNVQNDDKMHKSMDQFLNRTLVGTIKMDGENSTLYPDYYHARSIDSLHHDSRSWIKSFHAKIAPNIPDNFRICGENLYAKHSIHYKNIKSFFYLFSVWNEKNICLNWAETVEWSKLLEVELVPAFLIDSFSTVDKMMESFEEAFENYREQSQDECEGYVIRLADPIDYKNFHLCTAKVVRKDHVQTSQHWMTQKIVKNELIFPPLKEVQ